MRRFIPFLLIAPLLAAACNAPSSGEVQDVEPAAEAETMGTPPQAAEGLEIFRNVGCAGCHGQNGEGSVGPALAGHTREQVFRQVRNPVGDIMPAFDPDQLSDAQVEKIVAWIDTLGEEMAMEHGDDETGPELSMTEIGHLRLILDALAVENEADAIHHARHLVDGANPEVKPLAEALLADLESGNVHDVQAETTELLGPVAEEAFDSVSVHLGMALSAIQRDDLPDVDHHLEGAVEAAADHDHQPEMQALLDNWRAGDDPHAVTDRLYEALALEHPVHP